MISASADIKKLKRNFLPEDLQITSWEIIEPYFKDLAERTISLQMICKNGLKI